MTLFVYPYFISDSVDVLIALLNIYPSCRMPSVDSQNVDELTVDGPKDHQMYMYMGEG